MSKKPKIRVQTDGGGIPKRNGEGIAFGYIIYVNNRETARGSNYRLGEELTSNDAEYLGVLMGTMALYSSGLYLNAKSVEIETDSKLVSSQFAGTYAIKKKKFRTMMQRLEEILDLMDLRQHEGFAIKHIPRKRNKADTVIRKGMDSET